MVLIEDVTPVVNGSHIATRISSTIIEVAANDSDGPSTSVEGIVLNNTFFLDESVAQAGVPLVMNTDGTVTTQDVGGGVINPATAEDGSLIYDSTKPLTNTRRYPFSANGTNTIAKSTSAVQIFGTDSISIAFPYPGTVTVDFSAIMYGIQPGSAYAYMGLKSSTNVEYVSGWPMNYVSNIGGAMQQLQGKVTFSVTGNSELGDSGSAVFAMYGASSDLSMYQDAEASLIRIQDLRGIITYEPFAITFGEGRIV